MTAPTMTTAATNLGIAMQMLIDRTGHSVRFYAHGGPDLLAAWAEYLGPASHPREWVSDEGRWSAVVSTTDISVLISTKEP